MISVQPLRAKTRVFVYCCELYNFSFSILASGNLALAESQIFTRPLCIKAPTGRLQNCCRLAQQGLSTQLVITRNQITFVYIWRCGPLGALLLKGSNRSGEKAKVKEVTEHKAGGWWGWIRQRAWRRGNASRATGLIGSRWHSQNEERAAKGGGIRSDRARLINYLRAA